MPTIGHDAKQPRMSAPFDPKTKAAKMFAEFGRGESVSKVLDEIQKAHESREYYVLSLWREVRNALEAKQTDGNHQSATAS
ncbi:MAG: hypothetical protein JKY27_04775 [Magnetovibrio sp.]|nr:hypothetical protein [Magnetovibrio sp.]